MKTKTPRKEAKNQAKLLVLIAGRWTKKQGKNNKEEAIWRKLSNQKKNYNANKEKDDEIEVNERRKRRRNST